MPPPKTTLSPTYNSKSPSRAPGSVKIRIDMHASDTDDTGQNKHVRRQRQPIPYDMVYSVIIRVYPARNGCNVRIRDYQGPLLAPFFPSLSAVQSRPTRVAFIFMYPNISTCTSVTRSL